MNRYQVTKTLGDGTYGSVHLAINKQTQEKTAIKKMKKKFYSWKECLKLREVRSLKKLSHANIVKLKEVIRENNELFFVFEFMQQNLYEIMKKKQQTGARTFPEKKVRSMMYQCMAGLSYMHKHGFFHRDIKPENILVSQGANDKLVCKLADFGLAREVRSKPPYTDYVSTRWYRAPEVLLRATNYNAPIDIWAMGCIQAELYTFRPLFPGSSEPDEIYKICSVLGQPTSANWQKGLELAQQMNFRFPQFSPTPLEKLVPDASAQGLEVLRDMLLYNPEKRPTAAGSLRYAYFNTPDIAHLRNAKNASRRTQNRIPTKAKPQMGAPPRKYQAPIKMPNVGGPVADGGGLYNPTGPSPRQPKPLNRGLLSGRRSKSPHMGRLSSRVRASSRESNGSMKAKRAPQPLEAEFGHAVKRSRSGGANGSPARRIPSPAPQVAYKPYRPAEPRPENPSPHRLNAVGRSRNPPAKMLSSAKDRQPFAPRRSGLVIDSTAGKSAANHFPSPGKFPHPLAGKSKSRKPNVSGGRSGLRHGGLPSLNPIGISPLGRLSGPAAAKPPAAPGSGYVSALASSYQPKRRSSFGSKNNSRGSSGGRRAKSDRTDWRSSPSPLAGLAPKRGSGKSGYTPGFFSGRQQRILGGHKSSYKYPTSQSAKKASPGPKPGSSFGGFGGGLNGLLGRSKPGRSKFSSAAASNFLGAKF